MMGIRERLDSAVAALRGEVKPEPRLDGAGWTNAYTGMGTDSDRSRYTGFTRSAALPRGMVDALYQQDAIAAKIVDIPVLDSLANGWEVGSAVTAPEIMAQLVAEDRARGIVPLFYRALTWERLYGGAAICLVYGDELTALPLNPLAAPILRGMFVVHRYETWPGTFDADVSSPTYGEPLTYRIRRESAYGGQASEQVWHRSRMLLFPGRPLPAFVRSQNWGWSDSIYDLIWEALKRSGTGSSATTTLLEEFSQTVIKVPLLREAVAKLGAEYIRTKLQTLRMSMGVGKALILGDGEEYSRVSGGTAGIAEILNVLREEVAAAADIPMRRLYGLMPAGLATSGDTDLTFYYGALQALVQEQRMRPALERYYDVLLRSPEWSEGKPNPFGGKPPEDWKLTFRPLSTMLPTEEAAVRTSYVGSLTALTTAGIIDPIDDARPALALRYPEMVTEQPLGEAGDEEQDPGVDTRPTPEVVAAAGRGYQLYLASDRTTPRWVVTQAGLLQNRAPYGYGALVKLRAWYVANESGLTDPKVALAWEMLGGAVGRSWADQTIRALDQDADGIPDTEEAPPEEGVI